VAAILAYALGLLTQKSVAKDNFQLKAAEIAMAARNSYDAKGKAVALGALFPGKLPTQLGKDFDPEKYAWGRESRRELLSLIAANAGDRATIVKAWKSLFPHDKWVDDLSKNL